MFCPKCGSILKPKEKAGKRNLYCGCGFTKEMDNEPVTELKERVQEARKIDVVEAVETNPKVKIKCEKCGHGTAYYWIQQTRGADEPETRFFRCTKCNHTWREYA